MSSQPAAARQCVRHARYRQYPPIRFSSLFRPRGDGTPIPDYRLHPSLYQPPIPPIQPRFCPCVHADSLSSLSLFFFLFFFFISMMNREAFNELTPRLLWHSSRRSSLLVPLSYFYLALFSFFQIHFDSGWDPFGIAFVSIYQLGIVFHRREI